MNKSFKWVCEQDLQFVEKKEQQFIHGFRVFFYTVKKLLPKSNQLGFLSNFNRNYMTDFYIKLNLV